MRRKIGIALLGLLVLGVGYLITAKPFNQPANVHKLPVVASFYPMGEFARQVGGDLVDVSVVVKPGVEPHDYDPTPQDIVSVHRAKLFVYNGAGLEAWATKVSPELTKGGTVVVEASRGLQLLSKTNDEQGGAYDPHVWLDPLLAAKQVNAIRDGLKQADPAHAAVYDHNAEAYKQALSELDDEYGAGLSRCKRYDIVTSHQAFAYLAQRYSLHMVSIAGLSPDEEPTPAALADIASYVREHGVTSIFFETLASPKLAKTIASETGAKTAVFNPLEGLTEQEVKDGKSYISVQKENLGNLRIALECR